MAEVTENFLSGLALALSLDSTCKTIAFSDGSGTPGGRIVKEMDVLWLSDKDTLFRTYRANLSYIVYSQARICVLFAADVPGGAVLAANAYLEVNNVQYRIESANLENEIYQLLLNTLRTSTSAPT